MSRRFGHRSLGWAEQHAEILARVRLPEKIKCKECKRKKGAPEFSNRQLDDARNRIAQANGNTYVVADVGWITCTLCTATQVNELQCVICDEYKSLEGFAKQQRKKPDEAKCIACTMGVLTTAGGFDDDEEQAIIKDDDSSSDEDEHEADGSETADVLQTSDDENNQGGGVSLAENISTAAGAAWINQPRHSGKASAVQSTSGTTLFDRRKYGDPTASVSAAARISTPVQANQRSSPTKPGSVTHTGKWGKPKNPNAGQFIESFDVKNDWGQEVDEQVIDYDDLP